ncbi:MAG TPA: dienelactone hydrolase family protein [Thermoanaerobaculia bacterium]|nr:dienelactone hydrolase family protein [Thermoanaerobaculia bacterium]
MTRTLVLTSSLILLAGCATAVPNGDRLETTPRHAEWVRIDRDGRALHAWLVYPERSSLAPAVVVIHENRGLTDWVRGVADELARQGYIAIAPDMLSGTAPGGGKTSDFPSEDAAREAISRLEGDQVIADLHAAADYVRSLPSSNRQISVAGFCWGGARTWDFAEARSDLHGAYVFYGTGPQSAEEVATIAAPVYGFYGGDDARVNATIPKTDELMRAAGKTFDPVIYEGAGHAFMRSGEAPDASEANRRARDQAWQRWLTLLRR